MSTLTLSSSPTATGVEVTEEVLSVSLSDGREVTVPLSWYPRLSQALVRHRVIWELVGSGHGIHWPELDEDISVEGLLHGMPARQPRSPAAAGKMPSGAAPGNHVQPRRHAPARG